MDDFDLIRDLRANLPQADGPVLLRARYALIREAKDPASRPVRSTRPALGMRGRRFGEVHALAVGALAVIFAAGLVVTQLQDPPDGAGTHGGHASTESVAAADAAQILHNAALAAQDEQVLPARPDQYVFIESITDYQGETFACDGKAIRSGCKAVPDQTMRNLRQIWLSVDGSRDGLLREHPRSSEGNWNETVLARCPNGVQAVGADGAVKSPACDPAPAYLIDVPTNAAAMREYLQQRAGESAGGDANAFTAAGDLIREKYLPPAAAGALFEAMTQLPGITVVQDVVDAAGRHGVSVGSNSDEFRNELIFDRQTFAYLGERAVALRDVGPIKRGAVTGQTAQLRLAIVDNTRQLP